MTKEEIISMAREAGIIEGFKDVHPSIERFAKLIELRYQKKIAELELIIGQRYYDVLQEREACAKIAFNAKTYIEAAKEIRARGSQ